jgi:predicted nuclease of predicted toxin-antitoxin system
MPRTIRFHLDEHVDFAVAEGLRRRGIGVSTTGDAGLLGADDNHHILYAASNAAVIFTNDRDFLRLHDAGVEHQGIAYCHQQSRSVGEIIRALELIWEVLEPGEMHDRIEFI